MSFYGNLVLMQCDLVGYLFDNIVNITIVNRGSNVSYIQLHFFYFLVCDCKINIKLTMFVRISVMLINNV